MKESKILDKIRALLSKTVENGASESEMEQALIMARKLMAQYQIDESEIVMSKADVQINNILSSPIGEEGANWQWDLLDAIARGYNCNTLRIKSFKKAGYRDLYFWRLIGFPDDISLAQSTFEILIPFIRNLYKKRYAEYKATEKYPVRYGVFVRNYIVGFVAGLDKKMQDSKREIFAIPEQAAQYQLIVIRKDDIIKDWITEKMKVGKPAKTNHTKDVNIDAQRAGYNDGKQAEDKKQLH